MVDKSESLAPEVDAKRWFKKYIFWQDIRNQNVELKTGKQRNNQIEHVKR